MFARIAAAARCTRTERFARALIILIDLAITIKQMYASLIAALLGVLLNFLMDEVERRLLPFRRGIEGKC